MCPTPPPPPADEPKLIIDSDWKAQAQAEKEKLSAAAKAKAPAAAPAPGATPGDPAEEKLGFQDLVSMLATQALTYMGAFPDPRTGKAVIALDYAKLYIDMLGILEEKTKGNLNEAEQNVMTRSVSELRVEFVELVKAVDKAVAEGKISPQQIAGPGASPTPGGGIVTPGQSRPGPVAGPGFGSFGS